MDLFDSKCDELDSMRLRLSTGSNVSLPGFMGLDFGSKGAGVNSTKSTSSDCYRSCPAAANGSSSSSSSNFSNSSNSNFSTVVGTTAASGLAHLSTLALQREQQERQEQQKHQEQQEQEQTQQEQHQDAAANIIGSQGSEKREVKAELDGDVKMESASTSRDQTISDSSSTSDSETNKTHTTASRGNCFTAMSTDAESAMAAAAAAMDDGVTVDGSLKSGESETTRCVSAASAVVKLEQQTEIRLRTSAPDCGSPTACRNSVSSICGERESFNMASLRASITTTSTC